MSSKRKPSVSFLQLLKKHYYRSLFLGIITLLLFFYAGKNSFELVLENLSEQKILNNVGDIKILPAPYPEVKEVDAPNLTAKSVILMDVPSAVVIYAKYPRLILTPASTTKIMTALVVLDYYKLNKVLTVDFVETTGAQMGLTIGDRVTVENLLYGLLINSGNDAATILALKYPGGNEKFIDKMNKKAEQLHLLETHFTNVTGLEAKNHYTTSVSLARLAAIAMQNLEFAKIVGTKVTDVRDETGKKIYHLENVNKLLGVIPGLNGIKTGWTEEAGECLVASAKRNGRELVSVVLGSTDRFGDTKNLLEWGFGNIEWEKSL